MNKPAKGAGLTAYPVTKCLRACQGGARRTLYLLTDSKGTCTSCRGDGGGQDTVPSLEEFSQCRGQPWPALCTPAQAHSWQVAARRRKQLISPRAGWVEPGRSWFPRNLEGGAIVEQIGWVAVLGWGGWEEEDIADGQEDVQNSWR